ncbi:MAG TPA: hypothetical protein VMU39_13340 [Solirubrobacteraceae bacterium]|nr:hypothetical protein [Solirubrobacteraceae bacterium]
MLRAAILAAALALSAPATALADGAHGAHGSTHRKTNGAALKLKGRVASIDGRAKLAVLSLAGTNGKLLALDLKRARVRMTTKRGKVRAGRLTDVRMRDRVLVKLRVSAKVARADARAGISAPVDEVLDEHPSGPGPSGAAENATVCGVVQVASGGQILLELRDDSSGKTVTLDLSGAQVFAGHPPAASTAGAVVTGDHVLVNLGVSYQTLKADIESGTAVPVATLFDLGVAPSGGSGETHPAVLGGTITAIVSGQVTISFGDGDNAHTALLDISSATLYSGTHAGTATPIDASALAVGDRVYALLSVSSDVAESDVQSGTPIPVAKLYDAGPVPPAPPSPPTPPPPAPPAPAILGGHITGLGSGQVTISFGDGASAQTAILDISSATLYSGTHSATATPITTDALHVGDRVYAVLSVTLDAAHGDMQSSTPIPVAKLYDAGPPS